MRRIKAAAAALALLFGLSSAAVSAAQVLRTEIKMPALQLQIGSEADLSALTPADVKATLDGSPLTTASFAKNEDGVLYLVVLDISGSMPDGTSVRSGARSSRSCSARTRKPPWRSGPLAGSGARCWGWPITA